MGRRGLAWNLPCNWRAVIWAACTCSPMFHSNTERLIDYWRDRKPGRASPARAAVDPRDLVEMLPQLFILGRHAQGRFLFRLIGGQPAAAWRRDLRGVDLTSLWRGRDRPGLATALEASRRTAEPIVLSAEARAAEGPAIPVEILLAPLRAELTPRDRMLGLWQPLQPTSILRGDPLQELRLSRIASSEESGGLTSVRLATVNGRRIA